MPEQDPNHRVPVEPPPSRNGGASADRVRVCFAQVQPVTTPLQTYHARKALCGKTPRRGDGLTQEKDLVTCPACQEQLGEEGTPRAGVSRGPHAVATPVSSPSATSYRQLLESLSVEHLEAKHQDLQEELSAVELLLTIVRAQPKKNPTVQIGQ